MGYLGKVWTVTRKDIITEIRNKETVVSVIVFAFMVIVIMGFALGVDQALVNQIAPGTLWVAFSFGSVLSLNRSFVHEKEDSRIEALIAAPIAREIIYWGKMLANLSFMVLIIAVTLPIFMILMNVPAITPGVVMISLLAAIGFSAAGTLFAALAVNTKAREIVLPLLFLPVAVPLIIAAVKATGLAISGDAFGDWLKIIVAFDAIFLVLPVYVFSYVLEE